jgi:hypothetical protein
VLCKECGKSVSCISIPGWWFNWMSTVMSSAEGEERQGNGKRKVSFWTFRLQGKKINFFADFNINFSLDFILRNGIAESPKYHLQAGQLWFSSQQQHHIETGRGSSTVSYPMGSEASYPEVRVTRAWNWQHLHLVLRLSVYVFCIPSWCAV